MAEPGQAQIQIRIDLHHSYIHKKIGENMYSFIHSFKNLPKYRIHLFIH